MKKHILLVTLFCACASPVLAADCAKNSDACSSSKNISPFLEASLRQAGPPPEPAIVPARVKKTAPARLPEAKAAPLPVEPPRSGADELPLRQPAQGKMSSPLWLAFIGGGLALLYYYLSGGRRRKKGGKK
jgi:hypothetical protein